MIKNSSNYQEFTKKKNLKKIKRMFYFNINFFKSLKVKNKFMVNSFYIKIYPTDLDHQQVQNKSLKLSKMRKILLSNVS